MLWRVAGFYGLQCLVNLLSRSVSKPRHVQRRFSIAFAYPLTTRPIEDSAGVRTVGAGRDALEAPAASAEHCDGAGPVGPARREVRERGDVARGVEIQQDRWTRSLFQYI